jgi:hypothetical protein
MPNLWRYKIMTKTASSAGSELGLLAVAGTLTIIPDAIVIYFVRNYIAKGFAMGRVNAELDGMDITDRLGLCRYFFGNGCADCYRNQISRWTGA